jgi:hypothetical protein
MTKYLTLDGNKYVVSPQFAAAVERMLGTMTFDTKQVEADRLNIMARSNDRVLLHIETERLAYLTHVLNVANAIRVVGAHHDPVKEWGLDGWDAVHGNKHTLVDEHGKPCGCVRHYVFDHHSVTNHFGHKRVSEERTHYEIEPLRVCAAHCNQG